MITAARIVFAQYWKNEETPPEEEIMGKKILDCAAMGTYFKVEIKKKQNIFLSEASWDGRKWRSHDSRILQPSFKPNVGKGLNFDHVFMRTL